MRWMYWLAVPLVVLVGAPLLIVVPMSFSTSASLIFPPPGYGLQHYAAYFSDYAWLLPTANSLLIGVATALLTLLLVVPATFALVRYPFRGRALGRALVILPLIVPNIVMALGYYLYLGSLKLTQTYLGVILAHACLCVPIAYLILEANLKNFDVNLERAARSLGAAPMKTFWLVTFPILRPGFLAAGLFAFAHSFDEAVVALFISGRDVPTLPRKMFESLRMESDPVMSVVSALLLAAVLLFTILYAASKHYRSVRLRQRATTPSGTANISNSYS
ncbi:ABC transporter permease [Achromobacter sp. DMS1]|nr:ABC transporter permease [Achromobacter sp. DMS1]